MQRADLLFHSLDAPLRVGGVLLVTRAFGDTEFKPDLISSEPEVLRRPAAAMELSAGESGGTIPEQTGRLCCGCEVRCLGFMEQLMVVVGAAMVCGTM